MRILGAVVLSLVLSTSLFADEPDLVIADFEGDTYGEWKTTGDAFGTGPAKGTLPGQMNVDGFEGKGLVNSFLKGDGSTGTLTSPEFTIERKYLNFLIGGGKNEIELCVKLVIDGKVERTATGPNDKPGGTERLDWNSWDVADLKGKRATLQIVDAAKGGWGHINVDQIVQSNTRRGTQLTHREIAINHDYLLLPVKNGAAMRRVKLLLDGKPVREFEIELGDQKPDFVVTSDVRAFKGKTLTIEVPLPVESKALDAIEPSNSLPVAIESEQRRPQFHFTSHRGWLNDPNGLVYFQGEWHLFYQHNPFGWNWGNMHWGHAVSRDLLHWQELPEAIYPHQWGDWAFSGSAVVDEQNTSGFKTGSEAVLVAAYTSTGRGECIAFSNDRGRTWTDYDRNPVVKHTGRDPKVIWHAPSKQWVMAVYDEPPKIARGISFYSSPNLKDWTYTSRIEGFFECPDLFALPVDGKSDQQKWVLYGADGKYLTGDFDGKAFHPTSEMQQVWHGNFYAAQTFSDVPDGRRIQIGWANGVTFPGQPFNQQMTIPVELTLRSTPGGVRMLAWPVKEVASASEKKPLAVAGGAEIKLPAGQQTHVLASGASLELFDMSGDLQVGQAEKITLTFRGTPVVYDVKAQRLICRHANASVAPVDGKLSLRVIGDRGSLEIFANQGQVAMSVADSPADGDKGFSIQADGGTASLLNARFGDLKTP